MKTLRIYYLKTVVGVPLLALSTFLANITGIAGIDLTRCYLDLLTVRAMVCSLLLVYGCVAILNLASPMRLKPDIQGLVLHGRYIWGGGPGSTTPQKHLLLKIDAESINMLPI